MVRGGEEAKKRTNRAASEQRFGVVYSLLQAQFQGCGVPVRQIAFLIRFPRANAHFPRVGLYR